MEQSNSARDVAVLLEGGETVDAKWTSGADDLRAKICRLTGAARRLADGGYLDMLRI